MRRSIDIDELPTLVGQELAVSDWLQMDQKRIDGFADVTGDHQWLHVDLQRASELNGGTVAHGFLTLSLLPLMSQSALELRGYSRSLNYGMNRLRFTNAVRSDARIRLRIRLLGAERKGAGLLVNRECTVEIEGDPKPALVAEWLTLLFK